MPSSSELHSHDTVDTADRPSRNPALTSKLNADHDALHNDLEQARELARAYQRQLANKSNEFASLKFLLEKAVADLASMQEAIVELRNERHQLANEVMQAAGMKAKFTKVAQERDQLQRELIHTKDAVLCAERKARTKVAEREHLQKDYDTVAQALACSEHSVLELVTERNRLREELEAAQCALETAQATIKELWRKDDSTTGAFGAPL